MQRFIFFIKGEPSLTIVLLLTNSSTYHRMNVNLTTGEVKITNLIFFLSPQIYTNAIFIHIICSNIGYAMFKKSICKI